jgi:hypothetical protein
MSLILIVKRGGTVISSSEPEFKQVHFGYDLG